MPKPVRSSRSSSPQDEPEAPTSGDPEASLETVAKRRRRVFSAADKLRILRQADECLASGKRGALGALLSGLNPFKVGFIRYLCSSRPFTAYCSQVPSCPDTREAGYWVRG